MNNCLILSQYREADFYNDFHGKFYHFPKSYIGQFSELPIEFIYYEPTKNEGKGEFYGYGLISRKPFEDRRESGFYFVEIDDYKVFAEPVSYKNENEEIIEELINPHYNPQNAVRKVPKKFLDEVSLDGGIVLNFEADSHLIKVLGEQLIGSERVGILELIKNSIDAQASFCKVRLEKIANLTNISPEEYIFNEFEGPVIIIEDDGIGMSKNVIENGWLRPASTIKTNIKERLRIEREKAAQTGNLAAYDALIKKMKNEHGNRIPLGEKGVGRFATHRLGRYLELRSKTRDNPYELVLKIDWNRFDMISEKFTDLASIGVSLTRENPKRNYSNSNSGTQLIIFGGRKGFEWDNDSIKDLNRAILGLNSPNPNKNVSKNEYKTFNAFLECPQIEDLEQHQIYEETTPNFTLDLLVNDEGIAEYSELKFEHPTDKIPKEQWNDQGYDLRRFNQNKPNYWNNKTGEIRKPSCGAFYIHMDVWYRKREWIDIPNWREFTQYLEEFGGMAIYRDNILIFDAKIGSEVDWLGLAGKHIKQGFRISYRDFIGSIEIEQYKNFDLVDKTSREGLINNQAFKDLSTLTTNAIEGILLNRYRAKREELDKLTKGIITDPKRLQDVSKISSTFISNIKNSNYPFDNDPYAFFSGLWDKVEERKAGLINLEGSMKELQKSLKMLEEVQEQFVEQAGFGISVAVSLHEINKITSNFYHGIIHLIKTKQYDKLKIEELKSTSESLRSELKRLGPLRAIRNETRKEFNILNTIKYALDVFKIKLDATNISYEVINENNDFQIYGRYRALNQVFGNLIDNSLYWVIDGKKKNREIKVELNKRYNTVMIADSGNDINEIIRPYLFQPGYSLKQPPSGLGLYICKTYLNGMKARIYETPLKDRIAGMSGAHFTIDFSRTPKNREEV